MDDRGHVGWILCNQCNQWNTESSKECVRCGKKLHSLYQSPPIFSKISTAICIISFLMLILAIGYLPYSYYIFLRWVVFISAILLIVFFFTNLKSLAAILLALNLYGLVLIAFNPISPLHLDKGSWQVIDLFAAALFIVTGMIIHGLHVHSKYNANYFIPVLIAGGILFVAVIWITSGPTYYESPEDAFIQHLMIKECAISIFIFSTMGGAIFFATRDKRQ